MRLCENDRLVSLPGCADSRFAPICGRRNSWRARARRDDARGHSVLLLHCCIRSATGGALRIRFTRQRNVGRRRR